MSAPTVLITKKVLVKMVVVGIAELILAVPNRELTGTVLVRPVKLESLFQRIKSLVLCQAVLTGRGSQILEIVRIAPTTQIPRRIRPSVLLILAPLLSKSNGTELVEDATPTRIQPGMETKSILLARARIDPIHTQHQQSQHGAQRNA